MLKCHEVTAMASDWLDGDLTSGQRFRVRFHLMMCRHCRNLVDGLATTREILNLRIQSELAVPAGFQQRTASAIEERLNAERSGTAVRQPSEAVNDAVFQPVQTPADQRVRVVFDEIRQREGFVPNLFRTYAHNPELLEQVWQRVKTLMYDGELSPRLKNAIAVMVSQDNGCDYCVAHHKRALRTLGVAGGAIASLLATSEPGFLDGREQLLLQLAREANRNPHGMPPDLLTQAQAAGASNSAILEAIGVMELYSSFNRVLDSFRIPLEPELTAER